MPSIVRVFRGALFGVVCFGVNFSAKLLTTIIPSLVVKAILSPPKQREIKWKANRVNDADTNDN